MLIALGKQGLVQQRRQRRALAVRGQIRRPKPPHRRQPGSIGDGLRVAQLQADGGIGVGAMRHGLPMAGNGGDLGLIHAAGFDDLQRSIGKRLGQLAIQRLQPRLIKRRGQVVIERVLGALSRLIERGGQGVRQRVGLSGQPRVGRWCQRADRRVGLKPNHHGIDAIHAGAGDQPDQVDRLAGAGRAQRLGWTPVAINTTRRCRGRSEGSCWPTAWLAHRRD